MVDIGRALKTAITTGKVVFGVAASRESGQERRGEDGGRLQQLPERVPQDPRTRVPVHVFEGTNMELGAIGRETILGVGHRHHRQGRLQHPFVVMHMPEDHFHRGHAALHPPVRDTDQHPRASDCMETEDKLVFVVDPGSGQQGRGQGRGERDPAEEHHREEHPGGRVLGRRRRQFIKNVFYNYDVQIVVIENRGNIVHATVTVDPQGQGTRHRQERPQPEDRPGHRRRHHNVQSIIVA